MLKQNDAKSVSQLVSNLFFSRAHVWIGILFLSLSFAIGYTTLFLDTFGDEGDNLAGGLLIMHGNQLYGDIFSHHFPFPYYWLAFIFTLFGPSLKVARLSLLCLQLLTFATTMYVSRLYVSLGLAALIWNSIGYFYYGNMVLYQTFSCIFLIPIFVLTFTVLTKIIDLDLKTSLALGIWCSLAMLTNPLTVYSIGMTFIFLFAAKKDIRKLIPLILTMSLILGLYVGYLLLTENLSNFYNQTILFNLNEYSRYSKGPGTNYIKAILIGLTNGLYLFDPNRAMYIPEKFTYFDTVSRWLLLEAAYKFYVIGLSIILLLHRQFLPAAFVYLFMASALLRGRTNFDHLPLISVAVCVFALLVTMPWIQGKESWPKISFTTLRTTTWQPLIQFGTALLSIWIVGCGLYYPFMQQDKLAYDANFGHYEQYASHITRLACDQDVVFGYYPGDPYLYFFTDLPPVSKYLFMWPWVADVALSDVINELASDKKALVYLNTEIDVWGRPASRFLGPLYEYMTDNYIQIEPYFYISTSLQQACPSLYSP